MRVVRAKLLGNRHVHRHANIYTHNPPTGKHVITRARKDTHAHTHTRTHKLIRTHTHTLEMGEGYIPHPSMTCGPTHARVRSPADAAICTVLATVATGLSMPRCTGRALIAPKKAALGVKIERTRRTHGTALLCVRVGPNCNLHFIETVHESCRRNKLQTWRNPT